MKKILFALTAVLAITMFTVPAVAAPINATPATINLSATVPESATLTASLKSVAFNVTDPTAITPGLESGSGFTASGNWKSGTTATLSISSTDLIGVSGGTIPAATVQYKYDGGSFIPLSTSPAPAHVYTAAVAGQQSFAAPITFQLMAVPNAAADTYNGVVTLTLQVL